MNRMWSIHNARTAKRCDAGFTCLKVTDPANNGKDGREPENTIQPGDRYVDIVVPPWTLTQDDPDGTPFKLGEWVHERYHLVCWNGY